MKEVSPRLGSYIWVAPTPDGAKSYEDHERGTRGQQSVDLLCSGFIKQKFVGLALRRASEGRTPKSGPNLLLDPLLEGGSPLWVLETDIGCIDLDRVSDGGVDNSVCAATVWCLIPHRRDFLGSLFGEWQWNEPDTIDVETRVWTCGKDHRDSELAGESDLVLEDVVEVILQASG